MRLILLIIFVYCPVIIRGQTCCSGGVPLSGNIGLPLQKKGSLQIGFSYDINQLETLNEGSNELNDDSRTRLTRTMVFESGFSFTNKLALDLFVPFIYQQRNVRQFGNENTTSTQGLGDIAFLAKYIVINNASTSLTVGGGLKIPTGSSDLSDNGISLNADLQPGSGALDQLFWLGISHSLKHRQSLSFNLNMTYRFTGINDEYLNSLTYEFGDELSLLTGVGDQFVLNPMIVSPSIALRYRYAAEDRQNDTALPNTGGDWLFLKPAMAISSNPVYKILIDVEIPIVASVGGTQLTPTYRLNIGVLFNLNLVNNETIDLVDF